MINPNHSFKKPKYPPLEKGENWKQITNLLRFQSFSSLVGGSLKKTPANPPKNTTTATHNHKPTTRLKESRFTFDQFRAEFLQGPQVVSGFFVEPFVVVSGGPIFWGLVNKTFGGWFSAGCGWVEFYKNLQCDVQYSSVVWLLTENTWKPVRCSVLHFLGNVPREKKTPAMLYRSKRHIGPSFFGGAQVLGKWPIFLKVNPPKQGRNSNQNTGHLGFFGMYTTPEIQHGYLDSQNHHILREFQVPTLFRKRDVVQTPHPGKADKSEMKQQKSRLKMLQKDWDF